jgi:hypothetical protein
MRRFYQAGPSVMSHIIRRTHRNTKEAKIKWRHTYDDERMKLLKLCPSIDERPITS